jgi:hypothetical protein
MALNFGLLNTDLPAQIGAMPGNALAARRQRIQQDEDRSMGREQAQMQNALARMQMTKAQGEMDEDAAYKNALRGVQGGDYEQAMPSLLQASPSRALAFQKQLGENKKRDLDLTIERFKVIDRTAGQFAANPTRQTAVAGLSQLKSLRVDPAVIQQMSQRLNETPDEQLPQLAREFLLSTQEGIKQKIGELAPQYRMEDFGGYKQVVQVNPGAGPAGPQGERFGKTVSPSDAIAQQGNQAMRDLLIQERQMRVDEGRAKADERTLKKQATRAGAEQTLAVIDKALDHPGRSTATGLSGQIDPRNLIAGTDAMDFKTVVDQLQGKAFLEAFESLKGGGQITEMEGKKATDAMARLNRAQSDAEFVKSLSDLRDVVSAGIERMGARQGGPSAPAPAPAAGGAKFLGFE